MTKIAELLVAYTELMHTELPRVWMRFEEYFEVWIDLIRDNEWIRKFAENMNFVARLLGFILQDASPFKFTNLRSLAMGTKYTSPHFEYPLEVLDQLLKSGVELTAE